MTIQKCLKRHFTKSYKWAFFSSNELNMSWKTPCLRMNNADFAIHMSRSIQTFSKTKWRSPIVKRVNLLNFRARNSQKSQVCGGANKRIRTFYNLS